MKRSILISIILVLVVTKLHAQYTQVPDPNFEQALIDLGIDSEGTLDGQFLTADAEGVSFLYVDNRNISDLTGIEAFVNLEWLDAFDNNIDSIDLSLITSPILWTLRLGNNNLTTIDLTPLTFIVNLGLNDNNFQSIEVANHPYLFGLELSDQPISEIIINNCPNLQILNFINTLVQSIDLSGCINLRKLRCWESQIQSLDFSNNPSIEEVIASYTPLSNINLKNNPNLEYLIVNNTQLTELDVTSCSSLWYLGCMFNGLTELDVSGNPLLEDLRCRDNQITVLDLSNNPVLYRVWCANNFITDDFDLTQNIFLEKLSCGNNSITSIDLSACNILSTGYADDNPNLQMVNLKNGGNEDMISFTAYNCPSLTCVVVDDPSVPNENISVGDAILVGSIEECEGIYIEESVLKSQISTYPNPVQDFLHIENNSIVTIKTINIYNSMGKKVWQEQNLTQKIDISKLNSGIYMLQITTDKGVVSKKIMKE